ncbi:AGAP007007-PA-like protein [Anopheles sinensis]|uniref:AGAP007007-PA-like protein n=1 Tax=Anopheles sinensis TaxID=74873 RepID=A0A084WRS4_ANOSI|nr:AGAP007007-PA-like protein [Anopheles sinensis]
MAMRITLLAACCLLATVTVLGSPVDDSVRAALFRRMRLGGPKGQLTVASGSGLLLASTAGETFHNPHERHARDEPVAQLHHHHHHHHHLHRLHSFTAPISHTILPSEGTLSSPHATNPSQASRARPRRHFDANHISSHLANDNSIIVRSNIPHRSPPSSHHHHHDHHPHAHNHHTLRSHGTHRARNHDGVGVGGSRLNNSTDGQRQAVGRNNSLRRSAPGSSSTTAPGVDGGDDRRRLLLEAEISRLTVAQDGQLREHAQRNSFASFSDYFLAQLHKQNVAVAFAFDGGQLQEQQLDALAVSASEIPFYDDVDGIGDRRVIGSNPEGHTLTPVLNTTTTTTNITAHTTNTTTSTTTSLPAKVWGEGTESRFGPVLEFVLERIQSIFSVYKHEDQSRPGVPVADTLDSQSQERKASSVAAAPAPKESKELPEDGESASTAAPSPIKGGLNRLFARKKYSPLLRDSSKVATTEGSPAASSTVAQESSPSADSTTPSTSAGPSGSTRRTRPTRPGKLPRSTSPKPTVSVKPTKISSRFSKPTTEASESTVASVTQRTTRGRRTRPSKPSKTGTTTTTTTTEEPTTTTTTTTTTTSTTTTTTTTTTPPPPTTSTTTTTTTASSPAAVDGSSVASSAPVADPSPALPNVDVTPAKAASESLTSGSTTTTTSTAAPKQLTTATTTEEDDSEVPPRIVSNGQQPPQRDEPEPVVKASPVKPERVIPVVEKQDELNENESLLQSASYDTSSEQ